MIFIETQRYVKGFSSKHIALKVDVTGAESILFAGASVHLSARSFTGWAVKGLIPWLFIFDDLTLRPVGTTTVD